MVASNLLLVGSFRVGLNVGVKKTTAVSHILNRSPRTICDFKWAIFSNFSSSQIGLEQGTHLSITGPTVLKNGEVGSEGGNVNSYGDNDQTNYSDSDM